MVGYLNATTTSEIPPNGNVTFSGNITAPNKVGIQTLYLQPFAVVNGTNFFGPEQTIVIAVGMFSYINPYCVYF